MLSARVCKHDFIWYRQASASSNLVSSGNISSVVLHHSAQHSKKCLNIWGVTPQGSVKLAQGTFPSVAVMALNAPQMCWVALHISTTPCF